MNRIILSMLFISFSAFARPSINVMGPLLVGDPNKYNLPSEQAAWDQFASDLKVAKEAGVDAIATDIWWGLVETQEGAYSWGYYDKMVATISAQGLRWVPMISFHQLGGNVGDTGMVPVPAWVWEKFPGSETKSEQGNLNKEMPSVWATAEVISLYSDFFKEFARHFKNQASIIDEITIGLGSAGEWRFPSYNSHDFGTGFPTRGGLQAYSDKAVESFRYYMERKYQTIEEVNQAWGFKLESFQNIYPPESISVSKFFARGEHFSAYGKDFFDWYHQSLVQHGEIILEEAIAVFGSNLSSFREIPLGVKIPGVHWRVGWDRLAELNAGLISTSYNDWMDESVAKGYKEFFKTLAKLNQRAKIVLHYTAIEMNDSESNGSKAKSMVSWMGDSAEKFGVEIKGENALPYGILTVDGWLNMGDAISQSGYSGVTLLRLHVLVSSGLAIQGVKRLKELD